MIKQRYPWASGKTKPHPTTKPKPRRRRRKMSTRGKALASFWEASALLLLGCSQIFQMSALIFAGATSAGLGAATVYFETRQPRAVPGPAVARPKSAKPPKTTRSRGKRGQPGTDDPNCTRTGQPISQCSCSSRHVATAAGARRFKRQVGDPMVGKGTTKPATMPAAAKPAKQVRVPTTNNAKPIPVGERMRRVL